MAQAQNETIKKIGSVRARLMNSAYDRKGPKYMSVSVISMMEDAIYKYYKL